MVLRHHWKQQTQGILRIEQQRRQQPTTLGMRKTWGQIQVSQTAFWCPRIHDGFWKCRPRLFDGFQTVSIFAIWIICPYSMIGVFEGCSKHQTGISAMRKLIQHQLISTIKISIIMLAGDMPILLYPFLPKFCTIIEPSPLRKFWAPLQGTPVRFWTTRRPNAGAQSIRRMPEVPWWCT